jgi:hypothetical protein
MGDVPVVGEESGVALVTAVFALAIIGALVASSFFAGRLEQQSGQNTFFATQAREAAEAGLSESFANLPTEMLESLAAGAELELGTHVVGPDVTVENTVARLNSRLFLIRADGRRTGMEGTVLATRTLGLLVQLITPDSAVGGEAENSPGIARLTERAWIQLY